MVYYRLPKKYLYICIYIYILHWLRVWSGRNPTNTLRGLLSTSDNICSICFVFGLEEPDGYTVPLIYDRLPNRCVAVCFVVYYRLPKIYAPFDSELGGMTHSLAHRAQSFVVENAASQLSNTKTHNRTTVIRLIFRVMEPVNHYNMTPYNKRETMPVSQLSLQRQLPIKTKNSE